ncbi:MAG: HU family DNA-binding protein [Ruminococcaceae bacterium]|nr:HU family DNA-binding protein [Oscillospiraceae bacterium]
MNKTELVAAIVAKTGVAKKVAEANLNATIEAITEALVKGDKVSLVGFGNFEVRERAAREGKNPQTGEAIKIAACKVPAFKAGQALKNAVK